MRSTNKLYRQNALDRVRSPEDLNSYIKVTTPSLWVVLAAVLILLAGLGVWALFGTVTLQNADGVGGAVRPISFLIG